MRRSTRQHRPVQFEPIAAEAISRFPTPLRIGVLSDTHLFQGGSRQLPGEVLRLFRRFQVQLILHAGDINTVGVLETLAEVAPTLAVRGNNDELLLQERLPAWLAIDVGRWRLAMLHGDGGRSAKRVATEDFDQRADLVVFGHSHLPEIDERDGVIYFNPGSPLDRRSAAHFGLGYIEVTESAIRPELILFSRAQELDAVMPR